MRRLQGPRQCRDARRLPHRARVRRRGDRPVPHRAYVLRRRADHRRPPDDPRRGRGRPPRRARQAAARPARRLRRDLPDHGRAAGHHPPARSAAARIPAARRGGVRRGRRGRRASTVETLRAAPPSCTSSIRCSAIAAAGSASPIPRSTRCRPAPSSRRRCDVARRRRRGADPRGDGAAGRDPGASSTIIRALIERDRRGGVRRAGRDASTIWSAR